MFNKAYKTEIVEKLVSEIRNLDAEEIADLDNFNEASAITNANFPISVEVRFETDSQGAELGAYTGHETGSFWFNVDADEADEELSQTILCCIDDAIEFQTENEAAAA